MYQLQSKSVEPAPEKAVEQAQARAAAMRSIMISAGVYIEEVKPVEQEEVVSWWVD